MKEFSVKECLTFGWKTFRLRPWFFIGATAVLLLAGVIARLPDTLTHSNNPHLTVLSIVGVVVTILLSILISMGKTAFYLRAHDAPESVALYDLWHPRPYWKFVGAGILTSVAVVVGFILLVVPGIILLVMTCFVLYLVIDREMGPIEAFKESIRLTKGNRRSLFLLGLAILGINIVGFCLLLVGLLVSIPVSGLAAARAYRRLSGNVRSTAPVALS